MIRVTPDIFLDENELSVSFVRSSGPGGQNVNKVSTAVELRFDAMGSPSLPAELKHRLRDIAGGAMTADGIIIIDARRYRSQPRNREDATERLLEMLRRASVKPRRRIRTRPTKASRQRRLASKKLHAQTKANRRRDIHE